MNSIVSLKSCKEYDLILIKKQLLETIEELGGLDKYILKTDKVLLKVNLLMKKKPEEVTTTNPVFVEALASILIENGNTVIIGDSPGGPFNSTMLNPIYKSAKMDEVAKNTGAILNTNYNKKDVQINGFLMKNLTVVDMLSDVDKVISVAKLKTHGMMTYTGAVKNMFGIIPGVIKAEYHLNMSNYTNFSNALVDICQYANPVLSFMDAIVGMEGNGPSAGTPRKIGLILASNSPYHLDMVACKVISLPIDNVPIGQRCIEREICKADLSDISLVGDDINQFIINDYVIPDTHPVDFSLSKRPPILRKILNKYAQTKPVFDSKKCVRCGICQQVCPATVITDSEIFPVVDYTKCIRCFCCQELCPKKAITIHKPIIARLIRGKN